MFSMYIKVINIYTIYIYIYIIIFSHLSFYTSKQKETNKIKYEY